MKTNSILFLISGILKVMVSAFFIFIFGFAFLLMKFFKKILLESSDLVNNMINAFVDLDPEKFGYLKTISIDEAVEFILSNIRILSLVIVIVYACILIIGIINIVLSKKYKYGFELTKGKKILLLVFSWLFIFNIVSNTLTTIALFIRNEDNKKNRLYSKNDGQFNNLEV